MMTLNRTLNAINASLLLTGLLAGLSGWFTVCGAVELSPALIQKQVVAHVKEKLKSYVSQDDQAYITVETVIPPYVALDFPQVKDAKAIKIGTESNLSDTYSERTIVRVHLESPDGSKRELGVPVHITVKKPVWVVKAPLNAQHPLRLSDFTLQTRDVSCNYSYAVGQETNLGDYVARVNLQPGEVLDNRKIAIPPDVSYNADVMILISSNSGMTLSVPGVAMSNGRIGDTIRVRQSVFQSKYYNARIINKGQVLVQI